MLPGNPDRSSALRPSVSGLASGRTRWAAGAFTPGPGGGRRAGGGRMDLQTSGLHVEDGSVLLFHPSQAELTRFLSSFLYFVSIRPIP